MTDPSALTTIVDRYGLPLGMLCVFGWVIVALYKRGLQKDAEVLQLAAAVTEMNQSFTTWDKLRREREQYERETLHGKLDHLAKQLEDLGRSVGGRHGSP